MGRDPDYRTFDQCNLKWNLVNKFETHCNGIYRNFEKHWPNGESEASFLIKTHTTFQDDISTQWKELGTRVDIANLPKRSRTSSYSSSQKISSDGHIGIDLNDDNDDIEEIRTPPCPWEATKQKLWKKEKENRHHKIRRSEPSGQLHQRK
uniref:Uncharacterized protein n=1 Tax=Lactuca sativa TaxID=4236 RepID=A0A9R1X112_LACSA|nr:hypothetical protein LSAT_V11C700350960 [Lactuca sativa]